MRKTGQQGGQGAYSHSSELSCLGAFDHENDSFAVYGDGVRVLVLEVKASQPIEHFLR